jgi:hypothetical protein
MRQMKRNLLTLPFLILAASAPLHADVLCIKNSVKAAKTGKVSLATALSTVAGATCPTGSTAVLNTATFAGPQGPQGPAGTNGANGTNGIVPLSSCKLGSVDGSSCAEGLACDTELSCSQVAGASADSYMIAWDFAVSPNIAYLTDATLLVPSGALYPSGVRITTTSEDTHGAHTPTLSIFCCPKS